MDTVGDYSDVEYVFEPHTKSMPQLRPYLEALFERRRFMAALAKADLRTARSRTALGNIWSVLNPLFQAGIYFFLYSVLAFGREHLVPPGPHRRLLPVRTQHRGAGRRWQLDPSGQGPDAQLDLPPSACSR